MILTILAGVSLLVPCLALLFPGVNESIFYPLPGLVFIPALFGLRWAAFAAPMLLFFVWNPGLFNGDAKVPKRSYLLLLIMTFFDILWFVVGWKDGLGFQGTRYCYGVLALNTVCVGSLWLMFAWHRKKDPSFKMNLLQHWMLFAWLAWFAFPFFGELP